jgi:hypothetical protein
MPRNRNRKDKIRQSRQITGDVVRRDAPYRGLYRAEATLIPERDLYHDHPAA